MKAKIIVESNSLDMTIDAGVMLTESYRGPNASEFVQYLQKYGISWVVKEFLRMKNSEIEDAKIAAIFNESDNNDGAEFAPWIAEELAYEQAYEEYLARQEMVEMMMSDREEHAIATLVTIPSHTGEYGAYQ